ncbi:RPKL1 protein, partial [Centropus bengalensis]|nr:RPKL1 protein [Centropus bengalensis]
VDPNKERREAVKRKITQYLRRAEEIFNHHLQRSVAGGNPTATGYSSLCFRPIRTLSSAVENLRRCKVVGVVDKVQIVQDPASGETFILKSLPKSHVESRERQTIIPHGVPFMVKLLCYYVSEDSIFLHLEHVQGELQGGRGVLHGPELCCRGGQRCLVTFPHAGLGLCLNGTTGTLCATSLVLLCFAGEMLWSHLRSKYCVQQGSADSNTTPAPTWKTARGSQAGAGELPSQQGSEVPGAQALLTSSPGQLHAPCKPDPVVGEPSRGPNVTCGQLREQPPSEKCPSVASRGPGRRAWVVKEEQVQLWAAEILLALEGLHQQGVLCRDLNPRNLLLDAAGHVRLTFFGQWTEVEPQCCSRAREDLYSAPEVGGIVEPTEAADCWSFGSLLYELLSGVPLSQNHPSGIQPHTPLHLPEGLSLAATSLLTELLQYNPKKRLGSGGGGIAKLKSHSFFSAVPWNKLVG